MEYTITSCLASVFCCVLDVFWWPNIFADKTRAKWLVVFAGVVSRCQRHDSSRFVLELTTESKMHLKQAAREYWDLSCKLNLHCNYFIIHVSYAYKVLSSAILLVAYKMSSPLLSKFLFPIVFRLGDSEVVLYQSWS